MNALDRLKAIYGEGTFVTSLPDGDHVPWKPLSIGDFFQYQRTLSENLPGSVLTENAIFRQCVLDENLVENLDHLKAGTVSVVVVTILAFSGPQGGVTELNFSLEMARSEMAGNAFHSFVPLICQVFPGYKPEDVYALDYDKFMLRLAQAEDRLISMGILAEPIAFTVPGEAASPRKQRRPREVERLLGLREQHERQQQPPIRTTSKTVTMPSSKATIISEDDILEHANMAYVGHEAMDRVLLEHDMVQHTSSIYGDYAKQMAKGEKVKIKSVEERVAEFNNRARENQLLAKKAKKAKVKEDKEFSKLVIEAAAARKKSGN